MSMLPLPGAGAWLVLYVLIGVAGTLVAWRYALSRDLLDHPGERRSHSHATPRGGGIGIVLAMLAAMTLVALRLPQYAVIMLGSGAGLSLVAAIGWIDDHRPLSPWSRLLVHALAAALLGLAFMHAGGAWPAGLALFMLTVTLVNIWNFMDGIDGIATSQAVIVALAYAWLAGDPAATWLALALVAAGLGFLPFNLPRARIFLGDVGSGAIGYALAVVIALAVLQTGSTRIEAWLLLLLPPSAFLLDTALTLAARMVRRERWWTAHVGHGYQRLTRLWGRHWPVTLAYAVWAGIGSLLAQSLRGRPTAFIIAAAVAWYLGGGILWLWSQSRFDDMHGKQNR